MRCLLLAVYLTVALASARAAAPDFVLQSSVDWGRDASMSCHISGHPLNAFLQLADDFSDLPHPVVSFGISVPSIIIGPLAPAGLLREARNPFGFTPSSQVFSERTGFHLDASLPPGDLGLVGMPVADVLGLYCRSSARLAAEYGCFASVLSNNGSGVEALVSLSSPPPDEFGEEWFRTQAPWPGGALMVSGGRVIVVSPWFDMDLGAVASLGGRVEPGAAWHAQVSARADPAHAALLFSRVEGHYRSPDGTAPDEEWQLAFSTGVTPPQGSAKLSYTFTMDREGFAPGAFRHTTQEVALALERNILQAGSLLLLARVEGQKRIEQEERGSRVETAGSRFLFRGRVGTTAAMAGAGVQEGEGLGVLLSTLTSIGNAVPRLAFDARLDRLDTGAPLLTTRAGVTLRARGAALALTLGVEDLPLADVAGRLKDCFRMQVTFSVRGIGDN